MRSGRQHSVATGRDVVSILATTGLLVLVACGGADDPVASEESVVGAVTTALDSTVLTEPTPPASETTVVAATALTDACDIVDLGQWETITGLDLAVPEQDTAAASGEGATICGITAEGTDLPYLFTVALGPAGAPGSVENLVALFDSYVGMVEVTGIGDRALYWDQDTTYEDQSITDRPILAFESGAIDVTIVLNADGLDRSHLEQLAKAVEAEL